MIACPGAWKNFEDIEENLSLPEIEQILDASRRRDWDRNKFAAALKGVELDDYPTSSNSEAEVTAEDIKRRAEAKIRGISEDEIALEEMGIAYEVEDD
jgi:hypothetical protein